MDNSNYKAIKFSSAKPRFLACVSAGWPFRSLRVRSLQLGRVCHLPAAPKGPLKGRHPERLTWHLKMNMAPRVPFPRSSSPLSFLLDPRCFPLARQQMIVVCWGPFFQPSSQGSFLPERTAHLKGSIQPEGGGNRAASLPAS